MSQADKSHSTTPSKRVAGSADSSSKSINRRRLMIGGGAVGAAAAVAGVDVSAFEQSGPSELAALVHRYFEEVDAFNAWCSATYPDDDAFDARAASTYDATCDRMLGMPVRTAKDAVAALDWLIRDEAHLDVLGDGYRRDESIVVSLVEALRDYLTGIAS